MAEIRETEVERDAEGRVIGYRERVSEHVDDDKNARRKGGGFGWGLLLGALLLAVVIVGYAYSQGGFQQAGRDADVVAANVEQQTDQVVGQTDDALQGAADTTQQAVTNSTTPDYQANTQTGDTATN